ncbi:hypothetical protein LTR53_002607 [Teratosphaeriaceae sp. CCFEE 6253]|nr:hypothetical protein LTR53_002607 [Teratosphaeriaceae sp. CCFEE 6253]
MDTDKQVVTQEVQSGPENAPMVVEQGRRAGVISPVREADKEVVSSWQTLSREESAPIPVDSECDTDIKAQGKASPGSPTATSPSSRDPPPAYEALHRETGAGSNFNTPITPDETSESTLSRPEDRTVTPAKHSRMALPVVVPQLDVPPLGESVPFQRCYSDALASHDVSMRDFVAFLDGLTVAQAPTSAFQGLKMVGAGISMVPLPLIPLAGRGISALASSGSGKSSGRAKLHLSRAAREFFAPRGLRVSLVKDDDLSTQVLRLPAEVPRLGPLSKETLTDTICTRRLNAIARYAAPLRFDVPEQDSNVKKVDKLAWKHLQHKMDQNAKELAKLREGQWHGRGFEGAVEEEKRCSRLRWLVVQEL